MTQSSQLFMLTELLNTIGVTMYFFQPEAETGFTTVALGKNLEGLLILDPKEVLVFALEEDPQGKKCTGAQA